MKMLREIFLGIFNRSLSCKGPEYQRLFLFELNSASGNGLQFRSINFKGNINILLLLTGSFSPKPLKNHGSRFTENLSKSFLQRPNLRQKVKKDFLFSNIGIKQGKMGTETSKTALNAHVHLRTANQLMSRPERHVDDITDMRRSCRIVRTLPVGVHSPRRLGCLRSLLSFKSTRRIECFHVTSRRPYQCPKTMRTSPVGVELFS